MTTPDPIRRFVEATNVGDTEAFLATFTDNAILTDWAAISMAATGSRGGTARTISAYSPIFASFASPSATASTMPASP
jgi:hypothetical protein